MRIAFVATLVAGSLTMSASISASPLDQGIPLPPSASHLFDGQPKVEQKGLPPLNAPLLKPQARPQPGQRPTAVVCGMTLIPADPKLDAAIRHPAPENPNPTIRAIVPRACRQQ